MAITLRAVTGSALTHNQVDTNFSSLIYSGSISGSNLVLHYTGSTTLGVLPRSSSLALPIGSKWTDVEGGGISRTSDVNITGAFTVTGNTVLVGSLIQGAGTNTAQGFRAVALGLNTVAGGQYSLAQGTQTRSDGQYSHAQGISATATGVASHAEGTQTVAFGSAAHAEGLETVANGDHSHAEGQGTQALGLGSHAEGSLTSAVGDISHAEGLRTLANGIASHTEGLYTTASGDYSHAEGNNTIASGNSSHAEGDSTQAIGNASHAEGSATIAFGLGSHVEGLQTITSGSYQHVQGQYNITSSAQSAFIIGNGTFGNRSNLVFASGSQFQVTGSLMVRDIIQLERRTTTPTPVEGMIIASGSAGSSVLYYYNGTTWNALF
jgi:hypothetical protein